MATARGFWKCPGPIPRPPHTTSTSLEENGAGLQPTASRTIDENLRNMWFIFAADAPKGKLGALNNLPQLILQSEVTVADRSLSRLTTLGQDRYDDVLPYCRVGAANSAPGMRSEGAWVKPER